MEHSRTGMKLHCKLGTYFHTRATSQVLGPEIVDALCKRPDLEPEEAWHLLERRLWLHERVADPVADGRHRSAGIGVSTLTIVRVREQETDGCRMMLSPSSIELASHGPRWHVVPSGMLQPFASDSADRLRMQFSVRSTVLREFVEELFGVEAPDTGDGNVDHDAILQRPEARALTQMLDRGDAQLLYTGVAVNLLTLRPEICTVLIVHDPGWYEHHRTGLHLCNPHPAPNRDAELLPDQRWIQLTGLTRDHLEPDAAGQDVLRTATLVTPAWACLDLGLRVARRVLA